MKNEKILVLLQEVELMINLGKKLSKKEKSALQEKMNRILASVKNG